MGPRTTPEIAELEIAVLAQQHVLYLQISMRNRWILSMEMGDGLRCIAKHSQHPLLAQISIAMHEVKHTSSRTEL
jgi:hypothetical protein